MKDWKRWLVIGALFLMASPLIGGDVDSIEIPFKLKEHYIVVKGGVGELKNLNFVIDTGATSTYVHPRIVKKLGLKSGEACFSLALGRKVRTRCVDLDGVRIGSLRFGATQARVVKLPFVPKFQIDALIGLNLLKRLKNVIIDFQSKKVIIGPSEPLANSQAFNPNLPFILARFRIGDSRADLLLDTGAGVLIIFKAADLQWHHVVGTKSLDHVGGQVRLRRIMLSDVSLAGTEWGRLFGYAADIPPDAYGGLDGILGVRSLGLKRLQLDFPKGRLGWER